MNAGASFSPSGHEEPLPSHESPLARYTDHASMHRSNSSSPSTKPQSPDNYCIDHTITGIPSSPAFHQWKQPLPYVAPTSTSRSESASSLIVGGEIHWEREAASPTHEQPPPPPSRPHPLDRRSRPRDCPSPVRPGTSPPRTEPPVSGKAQSTGSASSHSMHSEQPLPSHASPARYASHIPSDRSDSSSSSRLSPSFHTAPSNHASLRRSPFTPASSTSSPHLDQSQLEHIINEVVTRLQPALQTVAPMSAPPISSPSAHQRTTLQSPASIPLPTTPSTPTSEKRLSSSSTGSIPVPTPYVFPSDLPSKVASPGSPSTQRRPERPEGHDCASVVLEELRLVAVDCRQKLTIASETLEKEEHVWHTARKAYERAVRKEQEHGREDLTRREQRREARAACKRAEYAAKAACVAYKQATLAEDLARQAYLKANTGRRSPTTRTGEVKIATQHIEHPASQAYGVPLPNHVHPSSDGAPTAYHQHDHHAVPGLADSTTHCTELSSEQHTVAYMSRHVAAVLQDAVECTERIHELAKFLSPGQDFCALPPSRYLEIALESLTRPASHTGRV